MHNIEDDPAEAHDLLDGKSLGDLDDPMVKKLIELVAMWWAEAGRYNVLPLDDRFNERLLGRGDLYTTREQLTFYPGAVRIPEANAPDTKNRSWTMKAHVDVPESGAAGPICVMGGHTNGWSLDVHDGKPVFCYNLAGSEVTHIRAADALPAGERTIGFEFEKTGAEQFGAGGTARLFVDDEQVGEGSISRTAAYGYSLDETFDVGCDKGSPVTEDYEPLANFTGRLNKVTFDLRPDFEHDHDQQPEADLKLAMVRQ